MINVVICDDHAFVRRGIRDTLSEAVDIRVTAEAGSYSEARSVLRSAACDVLVLDLNMPGRGGLDVLERLTPSRPSRCWWCPCLPKTSTPFAACAPVPTAT